MSKTMKNKTTTIDPTKHTARDTKELDYDASEADFNGARHGSD
jgi:hypothetical protein